MAWQPRQERPEHLSGASTAPRSVKQGPNPCWAQLKGLRLGLQTLKATLCWTHVRECCKIRFQKPLPTGGDVEGLLVEVTSKRQPKATCNPSPLPCTPSCLPSRAPLQVDLLRQGPRVDESPRLQGGRHCLRPLAAAQLHQEGVDEVWEEVQKFVVLVHLLDEKVDGAEGLQREGQEASELRLRTPEEPRGLPLRLTIRGSTAARRQMSALEVAMTLGVNRDCSRPISPWSINRAKGTFSATASHTSTRWLANDRGQGLWVTCHVPWQIRASLDPSSPLSSGWT